MLEITELFEAQTENRNEASETKKRRDDPVKRKTWEKERKKNLNEQERRLE